MAIPVDELSTAREVTIGDGETSGGYENRMLEKDSPYYIHYAASVVHEVR